MDGRRTAESIQRTIQALTDGQASAVQSSDKAHRTLFAASSNAYGIRTE